MRLTTEQQEEVLALHDSGAKSYRIAKRLSVRLADVLEVISTGEAVAYECEPYRCRGCGGKQVLTPCVVCSVREFDG
jgi:hypothetical protein